MAGGEFLSFNNSIFLSERETADRNYALAYYMKENDIFPKGFRLQECLDFYFQVGCCIKGRNSISLMIKYMFADVLNGSHMRDDGGVGRDPRQRRRVSHHGRRDTQTGIC